MTSSSFSIESAANRTDVRWFTTENPIDVETDSRDDEQSVFFVGFGVGDVRTPRAARG